MWEIEGTPLSQRVVGGENSLLGVKFLYCSENSALQQLFSSSPVSCSSSSGSTIVGASLDGFRTAGFVGLRAEYPILLEHKCSGI